MTGAPISAWGLRAVVIVCLTIRALVTMWALTVVAEAGVVACCAVLAWPGETVVIADLAVGAVVALGTHAPMGAVLVVTSAAILAQLAHGRVCNNIVHVYNCMLVALIH